MKLRITKHNNIEIDLSEYSQEVINYVFDQLPDRMDELCDVTIDVESDYKTKKANFHSPLIDLISRILDEKIADMEHEQKRGEANLCEEE